MKEEEEEETGAVNGVGAWGCASRLQQNCLGTYNLVHPFSFFAMAAPLIVCQEDGTYQVHDDGAALLSQLTRKIAVIVVAGTYRTGKSFLLNQLTGQKGTFSVGHTVESHTRGIWVSVPGLVGTTTEGEECDIVFMDSEGLASTDKVSGGRLLPSFFLSLWVCTFWSLWVALLSTPCTPILTPSPPHLPFFPLSLSSDLQAGRHTLLPGHPPVQHAGVQLHGGH